MVGIGTGAGGGQRAAAGGDRRCCELVAEVSFLRFHQGHLDSSIGSDKAKHLIVVVADSISAECESQILGGINVYFARKGDVFQIMFIT